MALVRSPVPGDPFAEAGPPCAPSLPTGPHRANSVEAMTHDRDRTPGQVDHLWIRVADLPASKRFYTTIAPHAGIRLGDEEPGRVQFKGDDFSFSLIGSSGGSGNPQSVRIRE